MDLNRSLTSLGASTLRMFGGLGTFSRFTGDTFRATGNVRTWVPLVVGQMRRLGVDSLPIALFLASFTGIVLALQATYTFTGAIPLYFVGTLVEKTMVLELGPVLTGLALVGPDRRQHRGRAGHHARLRADRRARDHGVRPDRLPGGAAGARRRSSCSR